MRRLRRWPSLPDLEVNVVAKASYTNIAGAPRGQSAHRAIFCDVFSSNIWRNATPVPVSVRLLAQEESFVYICESSSANTFSCHIDESASISDQQVSDFVRFGKPELHRQLKAMPVGSSDVVCLSDLLDNIGLESDGQEPISVYVAASGVYPEKNNFQSRYNADSSDRDCPSEIDMTHNMDSKTFERPPVPKPTVLGKHSCSSYTRSG